MTCSVFENFNTYGRKTKDGGGVGGLGVHLSPQMHQEYIYRWNSSHRTLAEALGHQKGQERSPRNQVG